MADWKSKLKDITKRGKKSAQECDAQKVMPTARVVRFIGRTVEPAFEELSEELTKQGRTADIDREKMRIQLTVYHEGEEEFRYAIEGRTHQKCKTHFPYVGNNQPPEKCQARVVLPSGNKDFHDLKAFTREGIIDHFLSSYQKWKGWDQNNNRTRK